MYGMREINISFIYNIDSNKIKNFIFYDGSFYAVVNASAPPWHSSIMGNGYYTIGSLRINETGYMV